MFGSVDFSDAFDSQTGSYLKYLGNDCFHASSSFRNHESKPSVYNHYSGKAKPSAANQGEYSAIRFMQSQRHDPYGYPAHYGLHGPVFNSSSYISHVGEISALDQNSTASSASGVGTWSTSTTQNPDTHMYSSPMSPSTYYDLSTVGHGQSNLAHSNSCTSAGQVAESYHLHKARDSTCRYANVIVGFREASDNDVGTHNSSLQSPNNHHGMNALAARNVYEFSQEKFERQTYTSRKRYLPTSNEMKNSWANTSEVSSSTKVWWFLYRKI